MLIAEELLLVGTGSEGRNLLGSHRTIALSGALLTDLVVRERLDVDDRGRLRVVDGGTIGEPLIDWSGNCGNLSAAVGPFAISQGLVPAVDPPRSAKSWRGLRRGRPRNPRIGGIESTRGSSWVTSLRFPPVRVACTGMPWASTRSASSAACSVRAA